MPVELKTYKSYVLCIKVDERGPDAWQIRPGSYFLLPFKEAFGRQIPRDFTIFLTIKPTDESEVRQKL